MSYTTLPTLSPTNNIQSSELCRYYCCWIKAILTIVQKSIWKCNWLTIHFCNYQLCLHHPNNWRLWDLQHLTYYYWSISIKQPVNGYSNECTHCINAFWFNCNISWPRTLKLGIFTPNSLVLWRHPFPFAACRNCLFRALGDQLEGHSRGHLRLRQETVQFMTSHRQDFEPFVEDDVPFSQHCKEMTQWIII